MRDIIRATGRTHMKNASWAWVVAAALLPACSGSSSDDDTGTMTDTGTGSGTDGDSDTCGDLGKDIDAGVGIEIEWFPIPGGTFQMGRSGDIATSPVHEVSVPSFEMSRTEVTVKQYEECQDAGACSSPERSNLPNCNFVMSGHEGYPMDCVTWQQAVDFCAWAGGRLPSEAEWEYAARGGGQDIQYPWGNEKATCCYAVMAEADGEGPGGCDTWSTWKPCSKVAGNTAQGLCDMAGNVWEWVQDWIHNDYAGAPTDGSAWEVPIGAERVVRGGHFGSGRIFIRVTERGSREPNSWEFGGGFRCARTFPGMDAGTDGGV
jgi:formylglycine-generating enzyme